MKRYTKAFAQRSKDWVNRLKKAFSILFARGDHLNQYITNAPCAQNALDLFKEEWTSSLPSPLENAQAGKAKLFEDDRIVWGIQTLGGLQGKTAIELGPLEGGHSYMLQKHGASSVISIEANPRAFLKCLIVKQLLHLDRVEFLCGDFMSYLRKTPKHFDVGIASGVLYHMQSPVELIALLAEKCSQLFLWTHYYDPEICQMNPVLRSRFQDHLKHEDRGFKHTLHIYRYGAVRSANIFCGGPAATARWLSREDILACCKHFGFTDIHIGHENPQHPNGPCFTLAANKKR